MCLRAVPTRSPAQEQSCLFGDGMFHNYLFKPHKKLPFQAEEERSEDVWSNMSAASNNVFSAPLALRSAPPDLF